jgi:hypothetical protein
VFSTRYWRQRNCHCVILLQSSESDYGKAYVLNRFLTEQLAAICSFEEWKRLTEASQLSDNNASIVAQLLEEIMI